MRIKCVKWIKLIFFHFFWFIIIIFFFIFVGREVGEMILYFGCRKKEEDFIYENELEEYVANGTLTKVNKTIIGCFNLQLWYLCINSCMQILWQNSIDFENHSHYVR